MDLNWSDPSVVWSLCWTWTSRALPGPAACSHLEHCLWRRGCVWVRTDAIAYDCDCILRLNPHSFLILIPFPLQLKTERFAKFLYPFPTIFQILPSRTSRFIVRGSKFSQVFFVIPFSLLGKSLKIPEPRQSRETSTCARPYLKAQIRP